MKKLAVFLVLFVVLISLVFAPQVMNRGHSGGNVLSVISNPATQLVGNSNFGHSNSEIFVNIRGQTINLSSAISNGNLTNNPANQSQIGYDYSKFKIGETANHIYITSKGTNKTLQQAINDGDFFTGIVIDGVVHISGSTWRTSKGCSYSCNCGKSGCSSCSGHQTVTHRVVNGVVSEVSRGSCS